MPNQRVASVVRHLYRPRHIPANTRNNMVKRIRDPPTISSEAIDFKVPHTAKTNQAWKYPNGRIERYPGTFINGMPYEDPKQPGAGRRKQESNFFITINTNLSPDTPEKFDLAQTRLKTTMEVLAKDSMLAMYLTFGPKDETYVQDRYADVIASVEWKANVEVGDRLKRLHAHAWLTITHYSQVQIDLKTLRQLSKKLYNGDMGPNTKIPLKGSLMETRLSAMPWLHVKLLPQSNWTDVMRQYIHKGMTRA